MRNNYEEEINGRFVEAGIFKWGGVVEMGDRLYTSYIICCSPNDRGEEIMD